MKYKIYTLGPERSYSDEAARRYVEFKNISKNDYSFSYLPYASDVIRKIKQTNNGAIGVIPIRNSLTGEISSNLKLLSESGPIIEKIDSWAIPIDHVLAVKNKKLTLKKCAKEEVEIISHIQALLQCSGYVFSHIPHAKLKRCSSTAQAASIVSHTGEDSNLLAICSRQAAKQNNLKIIAESLTDNLQSNLTTFIAIRNRGT